MNENNATVDYEEVKQKLAAKGWSNRHAARYLGVNEGYLSQVLNQRKSSIRLTARVEAMPINTAKVHPGQPAALRRRIAAHGNKLAA